MVGVKSEQWNQVRIDVVDNESGHVALATRMTKD